MGFETKPLAEITESDLDALVAGSERETDILEFKLRIEAAGENERNEALKDISGMANAYGGHILIGIDEKDNRAFEAVGIDDVELWLERINNWCNDGIEPKLHNLQARPIGLRNGKSVIAIRIPDGIAKPHFVIYGNANAPRFRCYRRSNTSVFSMGVREIKDMVLFQEYAMERVEKYFEKRKAALQLQMGPKPYLVISSLPRMFVPEQHEFTNEDMATIFDNKAIRGKGFLFYGDQGAEYTQNGIASAFYFEGRQLGPGIKYLVQENGYIESLISHDEYRRSDIHLAGGAYRPADIRRMFLSGVVLLKRAALRLDFGGPYEIRVWGINPRDICVACPRLEYFYDRSNYDIDTNWTGYPFNGIELSVSHHIPNLETEEGTIVEPLLRKFGRAFGIPDLPYVLKSDPD